MPKFPEPPKPAEMASLGADVRRLAAGTELTRLYFRGGRYPTLWDTFRAYGPASSRFDHHLPPPRVQRWSRAIYDAYPQVQGLLYPSSMYAHRPAVALYERAIPVMPTRPAFHRPLTDPALLGLLKKVTMEVGYAVF